jgi:hydroxymethylpyrimidine/phosphomethylpyrimidine kinase
MSERKQPSVLTIASSDSSGGAGIPMDLFAFGMLKVHGCSVLTGVTAQDSVKFHSMEPVSPDMIKTQFESVVGDFIPVALKTGMLGTTETVGTVASLLKDYNQSHKEEFKGVVVDPVLGTTVSGGLDEFNELVKAYRTEMVPLASLLTPNIPEAEALLDRTLEIDTDEKIADALFALQKLGARNVLLKGGHSVSRKKGTVTDWLLDSSERVHSFEWKYEPVGPVHGTGCMLSALIAAHMALGYTNVYQAVSGAESLLHECMEHTHRKGAGELRYFNTASCGSWQMHSARVYEALQAARSEFQKVLVPELVPEVGINFGYALPAAQTPEDICALDTRIIKTTEGVQVSGGLAFGASSHVARIILSAMSFDLRYRSALNLRYSMEMVEHAEKLGLTIGTFHRADEPDGSSTMEWGSKKAIEDLGSVPDLIYDLGGVGKEPMVRIIAMNPKEAVEIVKNLKKSL